MTTQYAGLGDVIRIQIDKDDFIEINSNGEATLRQTEEAKKRHEELKKKLFCTAPEGFIYPVGNGEYKLMKLSEEERDRLEKELMKRYTSRENL